MLPARPAGLKTRRIGPSGEISARRTRHSLMFQRYVTGRRSIKSR